MPNSPNIVVIWGSDSHVGRAGCCARGAPNIDRLAREGMSFEGMAGDTEASPTLEFVTGVSQTGASLARARSASEATWLGPGPTLAIRLKRRGYATGHFGAPRLGPREHGVSWLDGFDEIVGVPRAGADGRAAASPGEHAELADEALVTATRLFMRRQQARARPFFVWLRTTDTHAVGQRCAGAAPGRARFSRADRLWAHDENVGDVLEQLDQLGLTDDTFVVYAAIGSRWSALGHDLGAAPGAEAEAAASCARREPLIVRWPGRIQPGCVCNGVIHCRDWLPTLLAVAGEPSPTSTALSCELGGDADLDGSNVLPFLTGRSELARAARGAAVGGGRPTLRYDNWAVSAAEHAAASGGARHGRPRCRGPAPSRPALAAAGAHPVRRHARSTPSPRRAWVG